MAKTPSKYDFVVVGQGIAGTTLTWQLRWLGKRVLVVDRGEQNTTSRIAAGLMTPIVGKRLAASWRFNQLWPAAKAFYQRVEKETNAKLLECAPMVRLFRNEVERAIFFTEGIPTPGKGFKVTPTEVNAKWFGPPHVGISVAPAGRLDVPSYLDHSRQMFDRGGCFRQAEIDPEHGIELHTNNGSASVSLPTLNAVATQLVFCQGMDGMQNARFAHLEFEPAKGEILTLQIPGLPEKRVVHQGVWLAPLGNDLFLAGATFERDVLDTIPTDAGRDEILQKLSRFLRVAPIVRGHTAGIRPIVKGRLPVVGCRDRLSFFNGLGAKGALRAPYVAGLLANLLVYGDAMDAELICSPSSSVSAMTPVRITELAQQHVRSILRLGDVAIDATAGNGFDTFFLAKTVGETGRVFAFDIQQEAIERTRSRLIACDVGNVELLLASHEQLDTLVPAEYRARVKAVMFNLGYLPRGDKSLITKPKTTSAAIKTALSMVTVGGIVTILAYTGHQGGMDEVKSIERVLNNLDVARFDVRFPADVVGDQHPRLYVALRRDTKS